MKRPKLYQRIGLAGYAAGIGFDLVTELKALRADEGKRLSKATYAFDQVDGAVQAALRRKSHKGAP